MIVLCLALTLFLGSQYEARLDVSPVGPRTWVLAGTLGGEVLGETIAADLVTGVARSDGGPLVEVALTQWHPMPGPFPDLDARTLRLTVHRDTLAGTGLLFARSWRATLDVAGCGKGT